MSKANIQPLDDDNLEMITGGIRDFLKIDIEFNLPINTIDGQHACRYCSNLENPTPMEYMYDSSLNSLENPDASSEYYGHIYHCKNCGRWYVLTESGLWYSHG